MTEPLSVAASVCGLVSLGIQVCQSIVSFYQSCTSQDQDVSRTLRSIQGLLKILELLDETLKGTKFDPDEKNVIVNIEESISSCTESIEELRTDLHKFEKLTTTSGSSSQVIKRGLRKLSYPFKESTLLKLRETVQDMRDNLALAVECLGLKTVTASHRDIQEVTSLLSSMRLGAVRSEIKSWLKAPDPMINFNAACEKRHSKTGSWLIESPGFANWYSEPASFLWLNGFAGCGKTVLCSTLVQHTIERYSSIESSGVAFFFFDFRDAEKQNAKNMLRSLVLQLSCQSLEASELLEGAWKKHQLGEPPHDVILQTLKDIISTFDKVMIFLDAIDEAPAGDHRDHLIRTINHIRKWSLSKLHLLITSRAETDIRSGLAPSSNQAISIQNELVDKDIATYVRERLRSDSRLKRWSAQFSDIETALTDGAKGMFRWVECQFIAITTCRTARKLHEALRSLPKTLDETYERVLNSIDEESSEEALRLLTWLCFSERPLTSDEVAEALAIEFGEVPHYDGDCKIMDALDILDICPGLIVTGSAEPNDFDFYHFAFQTRRSPQVTIFRLAHFSIKEYLISTRILTGSAAYFHLNLKLAHSVLAKCCVSYLLFCNAINNLNNSSIPRFELGMYTAKYWSYHCRKSNEDETLLSLISNLFTAPGIPSRALQWFYSDRCCNYDRNLTEDAPDSPLFYAAFWGFPRLVSRSLAYQTTNVDSTGTGHSGYSYPLSVLAAASHRGNLEVVQLLLGHGADPNYIPVGGPSALQMACQGDHTDIVQVLLDSGACTDLYGVIPLNESCYPASKPLNIAVKCNHLNLARLLLSHGTSALVQDDLSKQTPLHFAAKSANLRAVSLLLEHGANPEIRDKTGQTPFLTAAGRLDPDDKDTNDLLRELSYEGAFIDTDNDGQTALHLAVTTWTGDLAPLLIVKGADKTKKDKHGLTPFLSAAQSELITLELMQSLLYPKAFSDCDLQGRNALHLLMSFFLQPSYEIQDSEEPLEEDLTPVNLRNDDNLLEKAIWLLEHCCTATSQDLQGNSALHSAAESWDGWGVVEMLMDYESMKTSRSHNVSEIDPALRMLTTPNQKMETPLLLLESQIFRLNLDMLTKNLVSRHPSEDSGIRISSNRGKGFLRFESMYDRSMLPERDYNQRPSQTESYYKLMSSIALRYAAKEGRWDLVRLLSETENIGFTRSTACHIVIDAAAWHGFSIDDIESIFGIQLVSLNIREHGERMVFSASIRGNLATLIDLADKGVALDCCDSRGNTPLLLAIAKNHVHVINFLDSTGVRFDLNSKRVIEEIQLAAVTGDLKILDFLTAKCFKFEGELLDAWSQGSKFQRQLDAWSEEMPSPLHCAILNSHELFVEHLVRLGHPLEIRNCWGETPLLLACRRRLPAITKFLLTRGAHINDVEDENEDDALSLASRAGSLEIVKFLIDWGVDHTKIYSSDGLNIFERCEFWLNYDYSHNEVLGEDEKEERSGLQDIIEYLRTLTKRTSH